MSSLKQQFEHSLKEYTGDAALLSLDTFVTKLQQELPAYFRDWQNPDFTGLHTLGPIAKVVVEVDSSGYVYTSLYNKQRFCMVGEASSPDLSDWGLEHLHEEAPTLVVQFLALCYEKTLPIACQSPEFLNLPRAEEIVFSVSEHSGWEYETVYVHTGEYHEIDYGNIRLKQLHHAANCYTKPGTIEQKFMDHLKSIDIQKCSDEFLPVLKAFIQWLVQEHPKPLDDITISWSSDFSMKSAFGGYDDDHRYIWPNTFDFYKWFSDERPQDLDHDDVTGVRHAVSNKIAEIACLTTERIVNWEVFKAIPKNKNFVMEIMNRTAGVPPVFYPFDADDEHDDWDAETEV